MLLTVLEISLCLADHLRVADFPTAFPLYCTIFSVAGRKNLIASNRSGTTIATEPIAPATAFEAAIFEAADDSRGRYTLYP